jgi:hypothetical protein
LVQNHSYSVDKAASTTGMPETTLRYRVRGRPQADGSVKAHVEGQHHGRSRLHPAYEAALRRKLDRAAGAMVPLDGAELCADAAMLWRARHKRKTLPAGVKFGKRWLAGFRARAAKASFETSTRSVQVLEPLRAEAATPERTRQALQLWEQLRKTGNVGGTAFLRKNCWVIDEVGHGGKTRTKKALVRKGTRRVPSLAPARLPSWSQCVVFNMEGELLESPVVIKGTGVGADVAKACGDAPVTFNPKSHMRTGDTWGELLRWFAKVTRADPVTNRQLLKTDGHKSRTAKQNRNEVLANALGIDLYQLDGHSTASRCEIDVSCGAVVKHEATAVRSRKWRAKPWVGNISVAEDIAFVRACTKKVLTLELLKKSWCATGYSDGTERGIDLAKALSWCPAENPVAEEPAAADTGGLSDEEGVALLADGLQLAHRRDGGAAALPPAERPAKKRGRAHTSALFLTGAARLAEIAAEEAADEEAATAKAALKEAGAAARKAKKEEAAARSAAWAARKAAAAERRAAASAAAAEKDSHKTVS